MHLCVCDCVEHVVEHNRVIDRGIDFDRMSREKTVFFQPANKEEEQREKKEQRKKEERRKNNNKVCVYPCASSSDSTMLSTSQAGRVARTASQPAYVAKPSFSHRSLHQLAKREREIDNKNIIE
jgi:hypothetical protein